MTASPVSPQFSPPWFGIEGLGFRVDKIDLWFQVKGFGDTEVYFGFRI